MSIYRVSTNTSNDNGVFHLRNREYSMDKVQAQISTGKKYRLPRENPVDVTQAMTFHSKIYKTDQLLSNINDLQSERNLAENKMSSMIEMLHRARELAIQGANGTYTADDRRDMAIEINELLKNTILDANSKYKDSFIFSGYKKFTKPFEAIEGAVKGVNNAMITEVKYMGDNGDRLREIDFNEYASSTKPGSEVYWADQFQIYSKVSTADFRLDKDSTVMIDNVKIGLNAGDNIYAIVDKINKAPTAVKASLDVVTGAMVLKSTVPHKIELSDIEGGELFQNLGILERGRPTGPDNYSQDAQVFGGSIFDVFIGLRDALLQNNMEDSGGRFLGSIENAITGVTFQLANTGALDNRLQYLSKRLDEDKYTYTENLSKIEDVDMAEALTDLSTLDFAHKAALSSLSKITKTTLMDFLR